jgi:hypothetical protein
MININGNYIGMEASHLHLYTFHVFLSVTYIREISTSVKLSISLIALLTGNGKCIRPNNFVEDKLTFGLCSVAVVLIM